MAFTAGVVLTEVRRLLRDGRASAQRYSDTLIFQAMSTAQLTLVQLDDQASKITHQFPLTAGTLQTVPVGFSGWESIDRNVDGPAISLIEKDDMDAALLDWHNDTATSVVDHVVSAEYARAFYVYPPNDGNGSQVEGVLHFTPSPVTNSSHVFQFLDTYQSALTYLTTAGLLAADSEKEASRNLSSGFYQTALFELGVLEGHQHGA